MSTFVEIPLNCVIKYTKRRDFMANICPKCNEENNDDAIFCKKCSYRLVGVYGQPKQEYTNDVEEPQKSENYMILCPCCKNSINRANIEKDSLSYGFYGGIIKILILKFIMIG